MENSQVLWIILLSKRGLPSIVENVTIKNGEFPSIVDNVTIKNGEFPSIMGIVNLNSRNLPVLIIVLGTITGTFLMIVLMRVLGRLITVGTVENNRNKQLLFDLK